MQCSLVTVKPLMSLQGYLSANRFGEAISGSHAGLTVCARPRPAQAKRNCDPSELLGIVT
jgi:hypothetical protein